MEPAGIGIGIITRGTASLKWMDSYQRLLRHMPVGAFWKPIIVEGKGWAEGRAEVVRQALEENFEWLFFLDDDVFVPEDTILKLLSRNKDIISGVYWTKSDNPSPVVFKGFGKGPYFDFPIGEVFPISGSGLGCCLINMKVFRDMQKNNIPFFKENWIMDSADGRKMKCPVGEDHYFFYHAGKLGYQVWGDGDILCDHYDVNKKLFYPPPEMVREITGKALIDAGRGDIVEANKKKLGLDDSKRNVVFLDASRFNGKSLEIGPLGGSETALINVSRRLTNDYNVHVYCDTEETGVFDGVVYHNINEQQIKPDIVVLNRFVNALDHFDYKAMGADVYLWCHDIASSPAYVNLEKYYDKIDKIILLSEWHVANFKEQFPFLTDDKLVILRNGVDECLFRGQEKKVKGRMVYSSTPFRGLDILAETFPEIKKRVPEAHLKVFSSMLLYGKADKDEEYKWLYDKLRAMDGVEYVGSVKQDRLVKEMEQAELLAYPNTYPETYCITAIEAYTADTPIVTSSYAGLKELVTEDFGVALKGNPHTQEYKEAFVNACVDILKNGHERKGEKLDYGWTGVSLEWKKMFEGDEVKKPVVQSDNINTPEYWDAVYSKELDKDYSRFDTVRTKYVIDLMEDGQSLWDVGCGTGEMTRRIHDAHPNSEIWGSDFSLAAIDYCRQRNKKIFYANHPLLNDDFEEKYFDIITIMHVLEHVDDPNEMIDKARRLLKDDGTMVIALPIEDDEWREHLKIWTLNDVAELLKPYDCKYDITLENEVWDNGQVARYKDGRPYQQAIVKIKFN